MGNLCIIPARGGSKRIPRKNIKLFHGKPIIAYSIELAINSGLFSEVMVSTDDAEIAEIALEYGAQVPFIRSEKNSNDFATTLDVLNEVCNNYRDNGRNFDHLLSIYPTAVLANVNDIRKGYLLIDEYEMVLPITRYSYPPQRSYKLNQNNSLEFVYPENANKRSQDLSPWFHDAGQWYWFKNLELKNNLGEFKKGFIEIPNLQVQDIDSIDDWEIAELKYKKLNNYV
jgi:pseudaminic acid cytidylyltransferase